jgi:chorismate mutase
MTTQLASSNALEILKNKEKPILIAGPCSAETEEQVLTTAAQLKENGYIDIFRAGVWKPRTRPGNFEGMGNTALPWLQQVIKLYNLPVAIEVANAKQVEAALAHDINVLWIGARTTVNPFSVQEIADALKGVDIPVFIKNPVNPDIELWTGALERIKNAGITYTGLIHRGFSSYGNANLRNVPMWQLAIEMKRRFVDTPIIIDPSHITGNRNLILEILQKAIDLNYDGAMIEVHPNPDIAWSDAKQQLTPKHYSHIINHANWRTSNILEEPVVEQLEILRKEIDKYDDTLLEIIHQRMKISQQIGEVKKANNLTILH